nr:MAG TPA_asm: hypothetical protein [Caudoviricetes sp.]
MLVSLIVLSGKSFSFALYFLCAFLPCKHIILQQFGIVNRNIQIYWNNFWRCFLCSTKF